MLDSSFNGGGLRDSLDDGSHFPSVKDSIDIARGNKEKEKEIPRGSDVSTMAGDGRGSLLRGSDVSTLHDDRRNTSRLKDSGDFGGHSRHGHGHNSTLKDSTLSLGSSLDYNAPVVSHAGKKNKRHVELID